jgi:DNA invertase Pin-like site-specific DNA recombinase
MDVAGYIRVSTEQQKEEGSHENQREALQTWADGQDHTITFYEDIAISGQADEREAYDRMMDEAERYDAVVIRELSRAGRDLQKLLKDIDALDERGVDFISLKEDMIDTTTADGQLFLQIVGAFNEYWANLARERAEEMVERRREQGKPIGRPKKLDDDQVDQVLEWHEMGLGYATIATLAEDAFGESLHRSTVRRYVKNAEAAE